MMRLVRLLALVLAGMIFQYSTFGQPKTAVIGGMELHWLQYYNYAHSGAILNKQSGISVPSLCIGIQRMVNGHLVLEGGIQLSSFDLSVNDKRFQNNSHIPQGPSWGPNWWAQDGNLDLWQNYNSISFAGYYFFVGQSSNAFQPYLSTGITFNSLLCRAANENAAFTQPETNETLTLAGHFAGYFPSPFIEVGLRLAPLDQFGFYIGAKYYAQGPIITGDYQNTQNENIKYTDSVKASGGYFALTLRCGGSLIRADKRVRKRPISRYDKSGSHPWFHAPHSKKYIRKGRHKKPTRTGGNQSGDNTLGR